MQFIRGADERLRPGKEVSDFLSQRGHVACVAAMNQPVPVAERRAAFGQMGWREQSSFEPQFLKMKGVGGCLLQRRETAADGGGRRSKLGHDFDSARETGGKIAACNMTYLLLEENCRNFS